VYGEGGIGMRTRGERNCYGCRWRQKEVQPEMRLVCGKDGVEREPWEWCYMFRPRENSPEGTALIWCESD